MSTKETEVEDLKAELALKEEELADLREKAAKAPKPSGTKMAIKVKDLKVKGKAKTPDFPEGGSDGKGNLIKFVPKALVGKFEKDGWKKVA